MKILYVLLVLTPILAAIAMLAGILGSNLGFEVFGTGFMAALFASFVCAGFLLFRVVGKKLGTPVGWSDVENRYPAPETVRGSRVRGHQFIRGRFLIRLFPSKPQISFFNCRLHVDNEGVLIEPGSPLFHIAKMFVTWDVLAETGEIVLPWYAASNPRAAMELSIQDAKFSLVVTMDAWTRHFAPHITKGPTAM